VGKPVRVQIPPSAPSQYSKGIWLRAKFPFFVKTAFWSHFGPAVILSWRLTPPCEKRNGGCIMSRFLGIDFSSNHLIWRPGYGRSNVWIADVRKTGKRLVLEHIVRVQELPGHEHSLERLAALLREGDFDVAAIDAPFSVPRAFIRPESYARLLERIGSLSDPCECPFCRSEDFVKAVAGVDPPLNPPKPMRSTDAYWSQKGLNVRSTLWAGARGGAAWCW
jgi:hypothetical protein